MFSKLPRVSALSSRFLYPKLAVHTRNVAPACGIIDELQKNEKIHKDFAFVCDSNTGELHKPNATPNLAHVISTDNAPLADHTFHQLLREQADKYDSDTCDPGYLFYFHETGEKITYNQFVRDVESTAKSLIRLGVRKGDRVGMYQFIKLK